MLIGSVRLSKADASHTLEPQRDALLPAGDTGGQFRSLAKPWADTATSTGGLMLAVLGGLADGERDLLRSRTAEGKRRAKTQGPYGPSTGFDPAASS